MPFLVFQHLNLWLESKYLFLILQSEHQFHHVCGYDLLLSIGFIQTLCSFSIFLRSLQAAVLLCQKRFPFAFSRYLFLGCSTHLLTFGHLNQIYLTRYMWSFHVSHILIHGNVSSPRQSD